MLDVTFRTNYLIGSYEPESPETREAGLIAGRAEKTQANYNFGIKLHDSHDDGEGFEGLRLSLCIYDERSGPSGIHEIASVCLQSDRDIQHLRDALTACLSLRQASPRRSGTEE